MVQTSTIIVGASISGLACAACLRKQGINYIIIDKEANVAAPWRNHYERLHLHTDKSLSNLPYKKFDKDIPRYPSRQQVVDYLDKYSKAQNINPIFNAEALSIKKSGHCWKVETTNGNFEARYVIMATGAYGEPKETNFKGIETFPGRILHSYGYKSAKDFTGQKVLVAGFGNSACEIAIDLYEQSALPSMAVRSPVNIVPRDLFGIPINRISLLMARLPPSLADAINAPVLRFLFGDIRKFGLKKKAYGTFQQIRKDGTIPVIDIGTLKHIRQGHIKIYGGIDHIAGRTVYFAEGGKEEFDVIIAAIGYHPNHTKILDVEEHRFEDLKVSAGKQKYFGEDGLYFCGFWVGPTGLIHEISLDAQKTAKDIRRKEKLQTVCLKRTGG